jgi:prefoldin subunit 5
MTEQEMNRLDERLASIEAQVDNMNRTLDEIMAEINKHKSTTRTITTTYDGEIMYRFKENKNKL